MTISLRPSRRTAARAFITGGGWAILVVPIVGVANIFGAFGNATPLEFMLTWAGTAATPWAVWALLTLFFRPVVIVEPGFLHWRIGGATPKTTLRSRQIESVSVTEVEGVTYVEVAVSGETRHSIAVECRDDVAHLEQRIHSVLRDPVQ